MKRASWRALSAFVMVLPAAGFADEHHSPDVDGEPLPVTTRSAETLLAESVYAPHWWPLADSDIHTFSGDWPQPLSGFEFTLRFQNTSALARVREVRSLSLLTLAEFGRTRFFLGVSNDGLLGLHFNAVARHNKQRYLEIIRMPYLKDAELEHQLTLQGTKTD